MSLFLIFLIFSPFLPSSSKVAWCSGQAWGADELITFGSKGQDGSQGQTGQNGRDSDSLTTFADGAQLTLNLAGQDGLNGENGANGVDALCNSQPQDAAHNLQAPDGGNGGNGGDGGDGGNSGSLTIYSTNP
ncbi:MAG: collagen-like protein, partial [Microcystaceae cyanobacterium]